MKPIAICRAVGSLVLASTLGASPRPGHAAGIFQNTGNLQGWDRQFSQHSGTNSEVIAPTFKGPTAVKSLQTFEGTGNGRYHSEIETYHAAKTGDDRYFGQAFYIPMEWEFHDQNVAIQQWAPDDNSGPWLIMNLNGDHLHWLGGIGTPDLGQVTKGKWIRIVTRIKLATDGMLEVWLDGKKVYSRAGNFTVSGGSIRWSSGIYCTRWINQQPTGPKTLFLVHDHFRVATTYEEADPATWDDGEAPPAADAGGAPEPDAAAPAPIVADAAAPTGSVTPPPAVPPSPPISGGAPPPTTTPPAARASGGCSVAAGPAPAPLVGCALALALLFLRRRP